MASADGEAFYVPAGGGRFQAKPCTSGPWDPSAQHGGPPSALLGRAVEALAGPEHAVARVTVEILRPVPLAALEVEAAAVRTGRRVALFGGVLRAGGAEVARARIWTVRRGDSTGVATPDAEPAVPPPGECPAAAPFEPWDGPSYFTAIEVRSIRGGWLEPGPAAVWTRMRVPLVAGEEASPLQRVLVAADSGNGISLTVPVLDWLFINTELTVHLEREARGEWISVDARTHIGPHGAGRASSVLRDRDGTVGAGNQALLVAPR